MVAVVVASKPGKIISFGNTYTQRAAGQRYDRCRAPERVICVCGVPLLRRERSRKVGQCPGILNGPQCQDTGALARFPVLIWIGHPSADYYVCEQDSCGGERGYCACLLLEHYRDDY
jgi:hypothetical protein